MTDIVCIGGGTGMAVLLRGIKKVANSSLCDLSRITAVITMFDDGGSSGRIVEEYGILPPGDIRNCLAALSDEDRLMSRLFSHRFAGNGSLGGHSVGNLLLTALTQMNDGDFRRAVYDAGRVLAVKGTILPSTLQPADLCAGLNDGTLICGESGIRVRPEGTSIESLFLRPKREGEDRVRALDECLQAIENAHMIVVGPGSLYTSLLPNFLVDGIADAVRTSRALKVFVCNIMTEAGETDGFDVFNHLTELERVGGFVPDRVLVNTRVLPAEALDAYRQEGAVPVLFDKEGSSATDGRFVARSLAAEVEIEDVGGRKNVFFHDAVKLAHAVMELTADGRDFMKTARKRRMNAACGENQG